jgi:integrase
MARKTAYTIRKRGEGWQVNLSPSVTGGGKRVQKNYKTKAEATAGAERELAKFRDYGRDYLNLTPEQFRACAEAVRTLTEKGFQATAVAEAARFFIEHNDPNAQHRTVAEVLAEFMQSKTNAGLADASIRDYKQKVGRFANTMGERLIHTIVPAEIEDWLNSVDAKGCTRQDYRRNLSIFFKFAVTRKYSKENSAAAVSKVRVAQRSPAIFTPQEVRILLSAAQRHNLRRMLPYFAIGCLCGIRPWELRRTSWNNINITTRQIYVTAEAAKTGHDRFVDMPDNLLDWLQLIPENSRTGLLYCDRGDFEAIRKNAGVRWENDIMRHSAASHLYAKTQNASLVTAQMGHGLSVFLKYYHRAVTKQDGELYFTVRPDDQQENVVPFGAHSAGRSGTA